MLLSLSWLRDFTPYEGTAEALGDRLTMLGLELEDIRRPYAGISSIVVGHVVACEAHPDSDHLHLCQVDAAQGELLPIVCGAPNVAAGQKVAVALVGTKLPDGTVIKKAKLRGSPSHGMICSERELALSEGHGGILVLPEGFVPGARLVDCLKLDEEILDISVTPNRADCLSVLGLARETALAFGLPLTPPAVPAIEETEGPLPAIHIADPELCGLYSGRVVADITVAPSPMEVRFRLNAHGVRPISNIVDVTNWILLECGQPLHSFDLGRIRGDRIEVRRARPGETCVTLDGQERRLDPEDLCICDAERIVGLAGVMGGQNTEIVQESRAVFLESAVFKPESIRRTSRRLGLSSEASYRFERGVDQERTMLSLDRACAMMVSLSPGAVCRGLAVAQPGPFVPARMAFRPARVGALLGVSIEESFMEKVLQGTGCAVDRSDPVAWSVLQPSWRPDLTREADLVEEVARFHGMDTIPPAGPPVVGTSVEPGRHDFWAMIKRWGAGIGLNEVVNYSFVGHADLDHLGLPREGRISVLNPLSAEQDALRTVLAPGLLNTLRHNLAQGATGLRVFELANVFAPDDRDVSERATGVRETGTLGLLLYGSRHDAFWPHPAADMDYADARGLVEHLIATLHLPAPVFKAADGHPYLLPCVTVVCGDREIGHAGRVKPALADPFHARKDVWIVELNLDTLREEHAKATIVFRPLPGFPPVRRDITLVCTPDVQAGRIEAHLASLSLPLLAETALLDVYEPAGGPERHLTFRLTFRHPDRTLKDAEVDRLREEVAQSLAKLPGVHL
ncbi:MAG: phenylalanine--tRNA ligase subunit beta [Desulfovibrio sp.]|jgi:phenylalanyl-tRNA synthetase beta chain|nr:phenylalanine--tRNA ligase subunit beta [Desulfovibrio sp.]